MLDVSRLRSPFRQGTFGRGGFFVCRSSSHNEQFEFGYRYGGCFEYGGDYAELENEFRFKRHQYDNEQP